MTDALIIDGRQQKPKQNEQDLWKELQECIVVGHLRTANAIIMEWVEQARQQTALETYGKVMWIIDDIRGNVTGDKRQVLEDLKDKLRIEMAKIEKNGK